MILALVEALRHWESHCIACAQCRVYDTAPPHAAATCTGPCGIGRAIILNLIHILQRGL